MEVIKFFSSDSYPKGDENFSIPDARTKTSLSNPDPSNYEILRYEEINGNLLVEIKYGDCTNYEGKKILLYVGIKMENLKKQKLIDPHFSNNEKYYSPFARFEPTNSGWEMGETLCRIIFGNEGKII